MADLQQEAQPDVSGATAPSDVSSTLSPQHAQEALQAENANTDTALTQLQGVSQKQAANAQEQQKVMAPLQERVLNKIDEPIPKLEHADMPKQPVHPNMSKGEAIALGAGMLAIGLLMGGKGHWMTAAAGMAGLMKGYQSGHKQRLEEEWKQYDEKYQAALNDQKQKNEELKLILDQRNTSIKEIFSALNMYASTYGARDAALAAEKQDISMAYKIIDQRNKAIEHINQLHDKTNPSKMPIDTLRPDAKQRVLADFTDLDIGLGEAKKGAFASRYFLNEDKTGTAGRMWHNLTSSNAELQADAAFNRTAVAIASLQAIGQKPSQAQINEARKMIPTETDPPEVRARKTQIIEQWKSKIHDNLYTSPIQKIEQSSNASGGSSVKGGSVLKFDPSTGEIG